MVSVPGRRGRQGTNAEFRQGTKSIKRLHFIALSFGSWSIQNNSENPSSRCCPLSCLCCATDHQNNPNWSTTTEDKSFKGYFGLEWKINTTIIFNNFPDHCHWRHWWSTGQYLRTCYHCNCKSNAVYRGGVIDFIVRPPGFPFGPPECNAGIV